MQPGRARDDLIRSLLPSVRRIAARALRTNRAWLSIADDIYSAGLEGLVRGSARYDPSKGKPRPYIERRIEGSIKDYLRSNDHLTRHFRSKAKATGVEKWSPPTSLDIETITGRSLRDVIPDGAASPEEAAERRDVVELVERATRLLSMRTQMFLGLYYAEEMTMRQIGEAVGLTESRVCQVIHEAHALIRAACDAPRPTDPESVPAETPQVADRQMEPMPAPRIRHRPVAPRCSPERWPEYRERSPCGR
jgi:RNA polymerase sigma factor for flagellar operon FliA